MVATRFGGLTSWNRVYRFVTFSTCERGALFRRLLCVCCGFDRPTSEHGTRKTTSQTWPSARCSVISWLPPLAREDA